MAPDDDDVAPCLSQLNSFWFSMQVIPEITLVTQYGHQTKSLITSMAGGNGKIGVIIGQQWTVLDSIGQLPEQWRSRERFYSYLSSDRMAVTYESIITSLGRNLKGAQKTLHECSRSFNVTWCHLSGRYLVLFGGGGGGGVGGLKSKTSTFINSQSMLL